MLANIENNQIRQILTFPEADEADWRRDLQRFAQGDVTLDRKTVGENSVKALQRLLIFQGYSTSSDGSFSIDGDFGRGTNRGLAQFLFEHGLAPAGIDREVLCYPCKTFQEARKQIDRIPDVQLTVVALEKLLEVAEEAIGKGESMCGSFEEALFQLNGLHGRKFYSCQAIYEKYKDYVAEAVKRIEAEKKVAIRPEWLLSIIKKETDGVVRPRFEQHYLTRLNEAEPEANFKELRFRSMSFGLGQVMGENYREIGADSAFGMFKSPLAEQVYFIGRFLVSKRLNDVLVKQAPTEADFRRVALRYNGPRYEVNHYHESLERWFGEFRALVG